MEWSEILIIILAVIIIFIVLLSICIYRSCSRSVSNVPVYTIRYDGRGFSSNDLSILNRKNVSGGSCLDSILVNKLGSILLIGPDSLILPPAPVESFPNKKQLFVGNTKDDQNISSIGDNLLRIVRIEEYMDLTNEKTVDPSAETTNSTLIPVVVPQKSTQ